MSDAGLTEQQRKWLASVRATLEAKTGRSVAEWVEVARTCPETAPRARQRWLKEQHGLGQNYASVVLGELATESGADPRDPAVLAAALWADPNAAAIRDAVQALVNALPQAITGQRKGYTSWSRAYAFAAARPAKGAVRLGLAIDPDADPRVAPCGKEGWSERLTATVVLATPVEADAAIGRLLRAAWERS